MSYLSKIPEFESLSPKERVLASLSHAIAVLKEDSERNRADAVVSLSDLQGYFGIHEQETRVKNNEAVTNVLMQLFLNIKEEANTKEPLAVVKTDGITCNCSQGDVCPLGHTVSMPRCTVAELQQAGCRLEQVSKPEHFMITSGVKHVELKATIIALAATHQEARMRVAKELSALSSTIENEPGLHGSSGTCEVADRCIWFIKYGG